jgi:heat shock protein HtpX
MQNQLKTVPLLGLLSGLSIAISYWSVGGSTDVMVGIALAAVINLLSWYQSDKIALAADRTQPISPNVSSGLDRMVQRLCDRGGLPMAAIFIVPTQAANAFATGRDSEHATVAVTEGILNLRSGYFC